MGLFFAFLLSATAFCGQATAQLEPVSAAQPWMETYEEFSVPVPSPSGSKSSVSDLDELYTASGDFFAYVRSTSPSLRNIAKLQGQVQQLAYAIIDSVRQTTENKSTAFMVYLRVLLEAVVWDESAYLTPLRDGVAECRAALPGSDAAAWAEAVLMRFELKTYSEAVFRQKITSYASDYPTSSNGPLLVVNYAEFLAETDTTAAKQLVQDGLLLFANSLLLQSYLNSLNQVGTTVVVSVPTLGGAQFNLVDQLGKVVVIGFWATWSSRSTALTAGLVQLYNDYSASGLEILSSSLDRAEADATAYIAANGMVWPQVYLPTKEERLGFGQQFSIRSLPSFFVIGKDGKQATAAIKTIPTLRTAVEAELLK